MMSMEFVGVHCDDWCATIQCPRNFVHAEKQFIETQRVVFYVAKPLDCTEWTQKTNNQNEPE